MTKLSSTILLTRMNRRTFLTSSLAAAAGAAFPAALATASTRFNTPPGDATRQELTRIFLKLLEGFLQNARNTDGTYAVCDFPDGTMLKSCSSPSGHTYVGVARMLPAIAVWLSSGNEPAPLAAGGADPADLRQVMLSIYQHAFDPAHLNYWGESNPKKADQRQVEACLVAYAFWRMGERFGEEVGSKARTELQNWLASCTVVPEHKHNHAWFSAINQVARLQLASLWPEFKGDEAWMNADLAALDAMARPDSNGWYNDYPGFEVYDWYNFWTYASHFLYWQEIAGERFLNWSDKFFPRLQQFLKHAPEFFAANGSHVLFGRSLIYRWAAVLPFVLAYQQKAWPHSPGLLRGLVRRNIQFFWNMGAFDEQRGKLRETFAPESSPAIKERYIDNGHPYWCMSSFAFLGLKKDDPFWTAPEDPLPVEKADFETRFPALGMIVVGTRKSGQVRWVESRNLHKSTYRDKYLKFGYSSHFPYNVIDHPDVCPWDQALVFRNVLTGDSASRTKVHSGKLLGDGSLIIEWESVLGTCVFSVSSRIRLFDEFEERTHVISALEPEELPFIELLEGSYSHGLHDVTECEQESKANWLWSRNSRTGAVVFTVNLEGYTAVELATHFLQPGEKTNILYPHTAVNTLRASAGTCTGTFVSLHYASPSPYPVAQLLDMAKVTSGASA
ncbi:MAG: DUF2264 domain-containing protein [Candidatus Sumerlaeaceae bacterium]